jgi:type II secretory pathway component PulF
LGQLEQSGVPLLRSLAICETLHPFEVYQTTVHSFASATRNGSRLSAVMVESDIFGARAAQLVQTGETSGHLGPILAKVGARIEEELLHEIRTVTSLFEPCLVVILALVIGTMVAALFLPIFQLATAV